MTTAPLERPATECPRNRRVPPARPRYSRHSGSRGKRRNSPCKWSYDASAEHARYLERHPQPEPQTALPEAA